MQHKTIEDGLQSHECRWIHSDGPPKTFCCRPVVPLSSYCSKHHKIVYVPATKPRRRTATMLPVDYTTAPEATPVRKKRPDTVEFIEGNP